MSDTMVYSVVAALALTAMILVPYAVTRAQETQAAETRALAFLARNGYRVDPGTRLLLRVTHEDDEGWWTGVAVSDVPARSYRHAVEILRAATSGGPRRIGIRRIP